ncbi:hypothetical protein SLS60_006992 [Paraconiothyrium brasiliense]|uniref:Uncharacterized protein n=1 Tax=Paraconiothyrium brasiliense TaxID=300254 RepID=A0ABR3R868_9PLEO
MAAVTCMILEIFVPTGPNNFFKHVQGIEAILNARGPPTSSLGADPAMLSGVRILCIVAALVQRRPSIWATDEWKSVPPLHADKGSLIRHEILLIMADCTVLRQASSVKEAAGEDPCRTVARARTYLDQMDGLYLRWARYNASMLNEEVTPGFKDPTIANHASATTYLLYNAALICITRILSTHSPSAESLSLQSLQMAASLRIIRCLELKAYDKREGSGESNTIGFVATKVAWETLGGFNSPAGRRLSRVVKASANGVFAVGAWDEPEELPEKTASSYPSRSIQRIAPLVKEQTTMTDSNYKVIELINVGEKKTMVDPAPFQLPIELPKTSELTSSQSPVFVT